MPTTARLRGARRLVYLSGPLLIILVTLSVVVWEIQRTRASRIMKRYLWDTNASNARALYSALLNFEAENHERNPSDLAELAYPVGDLLDSIPANPYAGRKMIPVDWGRSSPGDYSYWASKDGMDYCLVVYSPPGTGESGRGYVALFTSYGERPLPDSIQHAPEFCRQSGPRK